MAHTSHHLDPRPTSRQMESATDKRVKKKMGDRVWNRGAKRKKNPVFKVDLKEEFFGEKQEAEGLEVRKHQPERGRSREEAECETETMGHWARGLRARTQSTDATQGEAGNDLAWDGQKSRRETRYTTGMPQTSFSLEITGWMVPQVP